MPVRESSIWILFQDQNHVQQEVVSIPLVHHAHVGASDIIVCSTNLDIKGDSTSTRAPHTLVMCSRSFGRLCGSTVHDG
jgi:hypothetical protein